MSTPTSQLQPLQDPPDEEWEHCQALAKDLGLPCVHLKSEQLDHQLIEQIPHEVLLNYRMLPLSREGYEIKLAMAEPLDVVAEDMVRLSTGCHVSRVVAMESEILDALEGRLGQVESEVDAILKRIPDAGDLTYMQASDEESGAVDPADLEPKAPIIQLVSSIIGDAIRMGASDIHVQPLEHSLRVRYRLDGYLRTVMDLPKRVQNACSSRIKLMSGMDISESRKPQDGRARVFYQGRKVDLRVSSLPTFHGEKIVLRILDASSVVITVDRLGFNKKDFETVNRVLQASQGLILCTGPTGSGKTSTLYSALVGLNVESDNILTVEDPIEYQLEGIGQVQVNARAEMTFAAALRSILRQDPDVVLIGEIRDLETAEIAVQAAQTGHLVLSTLHTNDALSTVGRLVLMGVAPYLLASALLCIIAQRLVRRLCACREVGPIPEGAVRLLAVAGVHGLPEQVYLPKGCEKCNYVGYKGRLGLFEILSVTDRVRELLLTQASESQLLKLARSEGMKSLLEDGLAKCAEGHTSIEEVLRVITIHEAGGRLCDHCGSFTPPEHPICVYCGEALGHACAHCGQPIEPDWRVCPGCRKPLLDAAPKPAGAPPAGLSPASESPRPERTQALILLVTADAELRQKLSACLERQDYLVLHTAEVGQANGIIVAERPGVVVLDYDTPGLDARQLIAGLRSRLETSLVQVVLLTERGPQGVQGLDSGADEFLLKPIDENRLTTRIAQAFQRSPGQLKLKS